jgi:transcriptional regulator of arginine metabolism
MVVGIDHNEVAIVIRTRVGRAQAVGLELDALRVAGVLGTLAGDDTVVVIPKSIAQTVDLARRLRELVGLAGA